MYRLIKQILGRITQYKEISLLLNITILILKIVLILVTSRISYQYYQYVHFFLACYLCFLKKIMYFELSSNVKIILCLLVMLEKLKLINYVICYLIFLYIGIIVAKYIIIIMNIQLHWLIDGLIKCPFLYKFTCIKRNIEVLYTFYTLQNIYVLCFCSFFQQNLRSRKHSIGAKSFWRFRTII